MDESELRKYHELFSSVFSDAWKLFKKYNYVNDDTEWNQLIEEATQLREKYPGEFSQKIIMAVLEELDRRDGKCQR